MSEISSYPLCWPSGWKRSKGRRRAKFSNVGRNSEGRRGWNTQLTVAQGVQRVLNELSRMNVPDWNVIISSNVAVRRDGLPYSNQREPGDPGVAVYFRSRNSKPSDEKCIAVDRYDRVADNLAAIAATIDAMRAIERHGGAEILERAFTGFTALPPPINGSRPWQEVLGVDVGCSIAAAEASYRILAKQVHPDICQGGENKMAELNEAIRQARESL